MLIRSEFTPAWWLRNAHAQTMWAPLMRQEIALHLQPERLELPDGDFIDLLWDGANAHEPHKSIVVILHGLGGSIKSAYARGLMQAVSNAGWRPVFMHFRGSSGEPNRLSRYYHSGETTDVAYVVNTLRQRYSGVPIAAIGVSLGGNVILKWLGQTGVDNPLTAAVAVSVPFELKPATLTMNSGFSKIYQWRLLKQLRFEVQQKFKSQHCPFNLEKLSRVKNFPEFDELVTAPLHQFRNADEYYQQSSSRQYLPNITVPTLIIHAEDDPFMPKTVIPTASEISASTRFELSAQGGHAGFVTGDQIGKAEYWIERRFPEFFSEYLDRL